VKINSRNKSGLLSIYSKKYLWLAYTLTLPAYLEENMGSPLCMWWHLPDYEKLKNK
jgi:hypothetical protein